MILYGHPIDDTTNPRFFDDQPKGNDDLWSFCVGNVCGRGLFTYSEYFQLARRFVELHGSPTPGLFNTEIDRDVMDRFIDFTRSEAHKDDRYDKAQARWENGDVALGRMKEIARQSLIEGICPWCGTRLPCVAHDLGVCEIDGKGGLRQIRDGKDVL